MVRAIRRRPPRLHSWEALSERFENAALLVGNGASCAVWPNFGYGTLFQIAREVVPRRYRLDPVDIELFDEFDTTNFEQVLSALQMAIQVNTSFGIDVEEIEDAYRRVKTSLIESIHNVHVPWDNVPTETLDRICAELACRGAIFSTNYDLLIYWSIMRNSELFRDFFWNNPFDDRDVGIFGGGIPVYYLHGGLHLKRDMTGETRKIEAPDGQNLLDTFRSRRRRTRFVPLMITEGNARQKLASIQNSTYLSFCVSQFREWGKALVVFGHSLSESDQHLVNSIRRWGEVRLAYSTRTSDPTQLIELKARLTNQFPNATISLFDAATYPLGSPENYIDANV